MIKDLTTLINKKMSDKFADGPYVHGFAYSAEYVEHVQICHCSDRLSMLYREMENGFVKLTFTLKLL